MDNIQSISSCGNDEYEYIISCFCMCCEFDNDLDGGNNGDVDHAARNLSIELPFPIYIYICMYILCRWDREREWERVNKGVHITQPPVVVSK